MFEAFVPLYQDLLKVHIHFLLLPPLSLSNSLLLISSNMTFNAETSSDGKKEEKIFLNEREAARFAETRAKQRLSSWFGNNAIDEPAEVCHYHHVTSRMYRQHMVCYVRQAHQTVIVMLHRHHYLVLFGVPVLPSPCITAMHNT
jgi:hypothetical protein